MNYEAMIAWGVLVIAIIEVIRLLLGLRGGWPRP